MIYDKIIFMTQNVGKKNQFLDLKMSQKIPKKTVRLSSDNSGFNSEKVFALQMSTYTKLG